MKFLMLSATFGTGHNQVAAALAEAAAGEGHAAEVIDGLAAGVPSLSTLLTGGFIGLLKTVPGLWRLVYTGAEEPGHMTALKSGSFGALTRLMGSRLAQLIARTAPDAILCTHPFVLGVLAALRRQGGLEVPLGAVLTDFASHPFWLHAGVDRYYVATQAVADTLIEQGVAATQVLVTGIPIRRNFAAPPDRGTAARALGLDPLRPTVLLMGGGLGMGPMRQVAVAAAGLALLPQVLAVTGHNRRLFGQLTALAAPALHVYGYVPDVDHLMAASDLLVTKAGAVTASEALAMGLPMLLVQPIAGHEERNQAALLAMGAACTLPHPAALVPVLRHLLSDPAPAAAMGAAARQAAAPGAARLVIGQMAAFAQEACGCTA